jgi:cell division septal protein FtsQ
MKKDFSKQYNTKQVSPKKESKLKYFIYLFLFAFIVWFFFWSPVFNVKKIITKGTSDTDISSFVEQSTLSHLKENKNIFLLKNQNLTEILIQNSDIKDVAIYKKIPNKIEIHITISEPDAILKQETNYYLLQEGEITGIIDPVQIKWDLPTIIISTEPSQNQFIFDNKKIDFIKQFYQKKQKIAGIELSEFEVGNKESNSLKIGTSQGWKLILGFENDIDKIIDNLNTLLLTQLKEEVPLEYIDMRLEDKVFYK